MGKVINKNHSIIEGVFHTPLKVISDNRGMVMHHINYLSPSFKGFEESYISKTFPKMIKGWKKHLKMTQNFCVPVGRMHFILFDDREYSSTFGLINEFILDDASDYSLLSIPPNIWYGFECLSDIPAIIVNTTNVLFDPNESLRIDLNDSIIPKVKWCNEVKLNK